MTTVSGRVAGRPSEIHVANAPPIPGLRFRAFAGPDDLPAIAEILAAAELADATNELMSVEAIENWLSTTTDFDPPRDLLVAEVDGRPIAFSERTRAVPTAARLGQLRLGSSRLAAAWPRPGDAPP